MARFAALVVGIGLWSLCGLGAHQARADETSETPTGKDVLPAEKPPQSPEKPAQPEEQKPPPLDLGAGLKKVGPGKYELTREELYRFMLHSPFIARQLWVRQVRKKGKLVGYKLKHIGKKSLVYKAGFRNGDVVTRINGNRLNAPKSLLLKIPGWHKIVVKMYRAGKLRQNVYQVIP